MLGYLCKYTPVELFAALGVSMRRVDPQVDRFNRADSLMHPNVCSYVKGVLETFADAVTVNPELEGLVLTACCDSVRRLADTLRAQYPDKFFYLLDVPRKVNDFAVGLYEEHVLDLMHAYAIFAGRPFDKTETEAALHTYLEAQPETPATAPTPNADPNRIRIGLIGARANDAIAELLKAGGAEVLFNVTCNGLDRHFAPADLRGYLEQILCQFPCMRMVSATNRFDYLDGFSDRLDGLVYHTVQFCDQYAYEFAELKARGDLPVLRVETDLTRQSFGQIKTRIEAFIEELSAKKGLMRAAHQRPAFRKDSPMMIVGIDSGSTSTNAVVLNQNKQCIAFDVVRTGAKSIASAERALDNVLAKAKLTREDPALIVATGYGRVSIPFADQNVTEISCHGKGAHHVNPAVRTILDIGGQDSKAIHLNAAGEVTDFVMNDKCAAGTGRFLEMMARTLEVSLEELGAISRHWREDIRIASMCSVFAESEVISLIAQNKEKADIAHGVHAAIAGKALGLMKKVGVEPTIMMTGGVAKNPDMVAVLEEKLGEPLFIADEPEIIGALGAALFGWESLQ